jgi:hypothetical protein
VRLQRQGRGQQQADQPHSKDGFRGELLHRCQKSPCCITDRKSISVLLHAMICQAKTPVAVTARSTVRVTVTVAVEGSGHILNSKTSCPASVLLPALTIYTPCSYMRVIQQNAAQRRPQGAALQRKCAAQRRPLEPQCSKHLDQAVLLHAHCCFRELVMLFMHVQMCKTCVNLEELMLLSGPPRP